MASDVSLEDLQAVFNNFGVKLDAIHQNQTNALEKVLKDVAGQKNTGKYKDTLSEKFETLANYVKGLAKNTENNNEVASAASRLTVPALDGVKPVTASQEIGKNTKALPVRLLDTLDLKSKKTNEVKPTKYSSVYIEIPEDTKILLENVLHDQFKYFFDDLYLKSGGIDDIYNTLHNIYELLDRGILGGNGKGVEPWWKKLAEGAGKAIADIIETALGLRALRALLSGKGGKPGTKQTEPTKGETENEKTEAERARERAKAEEEKAKIEEKIRKTQEEARKQEIAEKEADIKQLEETIKKKQKLNEDVNAEEESLVERRTDLEQFRKDELKRAEQFDDDIIRARAKSILAGDESSKAEIDLIERNKVAAEENAQYYKDMIEEINKDIESVKVEREQLNKQIEQLKQAKEERAKLAAEKPVTEPVKPAPEPAAEPVKPAAGEVIEPSLSKNAEKFPSFKKLFKTGSQNLKIEDLIESGELELQVPLITQLVADYFLYQLNTDFFDQVGELSGALQQQSGVTTAAGERFKAQLEEDEKARKLNERALAVKASKEKGFTNYDQEKKAQEAWQAKTGTYYFGDMLKEEWNKLPVKEQLSYLDPHDVAITTFKQAITEATQYVKDSSTGKISWNEQQRRGPLGGAEIWGPVADLKPTESPIIPPTQPTDLLSTGISDMSEALGGQTKLFKALIELQSTSNKKQDDLIKAFQAFNAGSSVNIVNSSSTSINSQQTTTPATRSAFSSRSYGQ